MSHNEDDLQQQEDEITVLQSIYETCDGTPSNQEISIEVLNHTSLKVFLPDPHPSPDSYLILQIDKPCDYPSSSPPIVVIHHSARHSLPIADIATLAQGLDDLFQPGDVVLFNYIEYVKEQWTTLCPLPNQPTTQQQNNTNTNNTDHQLKQQQQQSMTIMSDIHNETDPSIVQQHIEMTILAEKLVHGQPFTISKSTFQAHICPVHTVEQVKLVVEILLLNNKIRQATHNIMAYRIERPEKPGMWIQDCDDDGENAAGGRLLHLLELVNAKDVVVVVSRWFGGILLGPSRFSHINNVARQLLDEQGYIVEKKVSGGGGTKRR